MLAILSTACDDPAAREAARRQGELERLQARRKSLLAAAESWVEVDKSAPATVVFGSQQGFARRLRAPVPTLEDINKTIGTPDSVEKFHPPNQRPTIQAKWNDPLYGQPACLCGPVLLEVWADLDNGDVNSLTIRPVDREWERIARDSRWWRARGR